MALHKAELQIICADYGLNPGYNDTVGELVIKLRMFLKSRTVTGTPGFITPASAASSGYGTPASHPPKVIAQPPLFSQAPSPYGGPTITQAPANTQAPVAYGGPKIKQRSSIFGPPVIAHPSPPDAPPLTDSDDDIVITAEPM